MNKKLLLVFLICFGCLLNSANAQTLFGNEWITDFSATYFKIKVAKTGLYRIDYAALQSAGLQNTNGINFVLYNKGEEVPIFVTNQGVFNSNDFIEFYGIKNDGSFDSLLYKNPSVEQLNPYYSLFSDTAMYYLAALPGLHQRITNVPNTPSTQTPEPYCYTTALYEGHTSNAGGAYISFGSGSNVFSSAYNEGEGYFGLFFNSNYTYNLNTPQVYTANPSLKCTAEVIVGGVYVGSNNIAVDVNGTYNFPQGVINFNDVKVNHFTSNSIPVGQLTAPTTAFNFTINPINRGYNGVGVISLRYPSNYVFGNQTEASFEVMNFISGFASKHLVLSQLDAQLSNVILYDFTNNNRLVDAFTGQSNFSFLLPSNTSTNSRKVYVTNEGAINLVPQLIPIHFVNYQLASHQGNFIIITHPDLHRASDGHDYIQEYAAYRSELAGGAYDTLVVDVNQLYDQFSYGILKHPLAIRNFSHFVDINFTKPKPYYFYLIGKGQTYFKTRASAARYKLCKIPTFGSPGADAMLTAYNNDNYSKIAISRLSVFNGMEIKVYLDKLMEYERQQRESCVSGEQNISNKAWMKRVLHLTGGADASQQSIFDGYLNSLYNNPLARPMKAIIEDTSFGASVSIFKKNSSLPIQLSASAQLDSFINAGVSIINFFGHSAYSTLEFAIDNPGSYKNHGRYPLMISNGCFTGDLFQDPSQDPNNQRGLSERFVIPDSTNSSLNIGAIGYLSTTDLGISSGLNYFTNTLYQNLAQQNYGNTLGECLRITRDSLLRNVSPNSFDIIVTGEQMTLNGDPAIRINPHAKPDYIIDSTLITLNPTNITFEQGSNFHVKFGVMNIGKAQNDSITIAVIRYFPNPDLSAGTIPTFLQTYRIKAPTFRNDFDLTVTIDPDHSLGTNRICVVVDTRNEVDEICDNNNSACIEFNISSLDILPIYPYQYAIVHDTTAFTLKGSTVDPFAPNRNYLFQIDTTEKFNSSLLLKTSKIQTGGVVNWRRPAINWKDSTVYYWRVAVDTLYGNHQYIWHNTSFTYIKNATDGWDQSHYYEFKKDVLSTLTLDSNNYHFKFADNIRSIKIKDFGSGTSDQVAPYLDYQKMNNGGSCIPYGSVYGPSTSCGGFNIVVLDSSTGAPLTSNAPNIQLGDYNCSGLNTLPIFQYLTDGYLGPGSFNAIFPLNTASNTLQQQNYLTNFLNNSVPNGNYVLMYSINRFNPAGFDPSLRAAIHSNLGTTMLDTMTNSRTYVYFGRKGNYGFPINEVSAPTVGGVIDTTFYFSGHWYKGSITTPAIGPAVSWSSLHWRYTALETPSYDSTRIDLIGVDVNGNETNLYSNATLSMANIALSFVNATTYPYLKIRMTTSDTVNRTPSQLKYWRINFTPFPEVALDKNAYFSFDNDTLQRGEQLKLKVAVRNVSAFDFDTLYMTYTVVKANNTRDIFNYKFRKIPKQDTVITYFHLNSLNYAGLNSLLIDANPYGFSHKNEQQHFNNIGKLNFLISKDYVNPLLDVTFDEQHILDGDIVSATPSIVIKLKDENKFLALDTITLLTAWLKSPSSNSYVQQNRSNSNLTFTPANNASINNTATIRLSPQLKSDGEYHLRVQGFDKSNNVSGNLNYEIAFQVVNKPMISNVLNYPNPFTTQTRFVFTLTGSELPTYFKIQILTISGKIVRELTLNELGMNLHIGRNISTYAWDGTDQFGSYLANGLYLYRVVTNLRENQVEHLETKADKYFKSGFGKMYLMR